VPPHDEAAEQRAAADRADERPWIWIYEMVIVVLGTGHSAASLFGFGSL